MFRAPALPRTLEASLRDLGSSKPEVRADAARDLTRHGETSPDSVVPALVRALEDPSAAVRSAAAVGLADLRAEDAVPALVEAVGDRDTAVAQMAAAALGEIGDLRAHDRLRQALGDERPEVRFQAAIGFPRLAVRDDAIDALLKATYDDDPLVCHIALRMAEELGRAEDDDGGVVDDRFMTRARALLRHDSPRVRVAAAIVLARAGDPGGRALLLDVGRGVLSTDDGTDEAAAIELCGELGLEAATEGLERRAFGGMLAAALWRKDRFAWHARVALARMGHARATREILAELGSWDRDKRTLAVAAAGRARLAAARDLLLSFRSDSSRADPGAVEEALRELDARPREAAPGAGGAPSSAGAP